MDYLSWKADNEATRGNSYPSGSVTSLTLTGLTEGAEYKVRVRSRYRSGGPHGPWSGPWTDEATSQVSTSTPATDPVLGKRGGVGVGARDEPLLDPPLIISDDEDDEGLQFAAQNSEVVLVSNLGQPHAGGDQDQRLFTLSNGGSTDVSFTTGSHPHGYFLTKATVLAQLTNRRVQVYLHADSNGSIGSEIHRLVSASSGTTLQQYSGQGFELSLAPSTKYWLQFIAFGSAIVLQATTSNALDSSSAAGWTINSPSGKKPIFGLSGREKPPDPHNDTAGTDFAAGSSTVGRLELGTLSSGVLSDRADRDLFKLEGLPATSNSARDGQANRWNRKRYRVQAWFGDHAPGDERGGEIFIMEAPSGSGSLYSAVSDTNEDGLSFFEFEAFPNIDYYVMVVPTAAIQVKSGSDYELENRTYTGAYKLKIDDVSHIEEMATTLHLATPSALPRVRVTHGTTDSTQDVGDRRLGLDRTVPFYTGPNSRGYVLNRIEAAVSQTEVSAFAANAKVSIYSDASSAPGTELFTLKTPADVWGPRTSFDDYEESFWVPSGIPANLTASTWYWVVFSMQPNKDTGAYYLDGVINATADAKSGWQIHPDARTRSRTITNDPWTFFQPDSTNYSIQIGIYASPGASQKNPVPLDTAPTD